MHGFAIRIAHTAHLPLAYPVTCLAMRDRCPLTGGRRHIFETRFPGATLSSIVSAGSRFSIAFSRPCSRSRRALHISSPSTRPGRYKSLPQALPCRRVRSAIFELGSASCTR